MSIRVSDPGAKEGFALMWYACECGHRERFWNSRNAVTPFCTSCPSCGQPSLEHVDWRRDEHAPEHKPHRGQRLWVNMTRERAEFIALRYAATVPEEYHNGRTVEQIAAIVAEDYYSSFGAGTSPDLSIHRYEEKRS